MAQRPAVPSYIFRGHSSTIHALHFLPTNSHFVSGDSEGWIIIWSLATKRAVAAWKAHEAGVVAIKTWGSQRLITHGRDHKLQVWQIREDNLKNLESKLPADGHGGSNPPQPWLLHSMAMHALNFCTFAVYEPSSAISTSPEGGSHDSILIAGPNGMDSGGVDTFELPSEKRIWQLHSDKSLNTGMVMAIGLFRVHLSIWCLITGYEDGHVMVHTRNESMDYTENKWTPAMAIKVHSQPVLSLDISVATCQFFTSSADANLAKFSLASWLSTGDANRFELEKLVNTKHAGQQSIQVRSDDKILATAGWDARIRVYSSVTLNELAVLKWHKEGCYTVGFANVTPLYREIAPPPKPEFQPRSNGQPSALDLIKHERSTKAQQTHWLAAGGKDGKISLWDIY